MSMIHKSAAFLLVICLLTILPGVAGREVLAENALKGPVTVATMIDSEGAIIGNMMLQLLKQAGFEVIDRTEFGTPDILRRALVAGEVDLVLDYTGSGQYYHETDSQDVWSDPVAGYEMTRDLDLKANDLIWLSPAPANNTEGLAVTAAFAKEKGLVTIQDLADYINGGGKIKMITSSAFAENIKGLVGFEEAYGFRMEAGQLIVLASGNTAEMLKALYEGRDGVNVSLVYGTDGALQQMGLVVLQDPMSIPPVYQPAPVVRGELYRRFPEIATVLAPLFQSFTLETLQKLNVQVAFEGKPAREVAAQYLIEGGFLSNP